MVVVIILPAFIDFQILDGRKEAFKENCAPDTCRTYPC